MFQRLETCVGIVTSLTNGLSEREANDALNAHVSVISPRGVKYSLEGIIQAVLWICQLSASTESRGALRGNGTCRVLPVLKPVWEQLTAKRQNIAWF